MTIQINDAAHASRCTRHMRIAYGIAGAVHDAHPNMAWRQLDNLSRYEVQAVAIALAAMVPIDQPGLLDWVSKLGTFQNGTSTIGLGLSRLIPAPAKAV